MLTLACLSLGLLRGHRSSRGLQPSDRGAQRRAGNPTGRGESPLTSLRAARSGAEVARLVAELKPRSSKDFTVCISAYGRVHDWRSATGLLDQMRQCGSAPNVFSFSAAISACGKSGQWERALELLDEMRERGVEPNVISFSAAISACEKGGQWERALELLEEMGRCGVEPNSFSYSAAIQACAAAGQPAHALQLFNRLEASQVDTSMCCFNAILDALGRAQPERARELWKLGCARGCYHSFERWSSSSGLCLQLDLHDLSEGAAETAVRWWLEERVRDRERLHLPVPERLELITGWGKSRGATDKGDVRARIETVLREMDETVLPTDNLGMLVVARGGRRHKQPKVHRDAAQGDRRLHMANGKY